MKQERSYQPLNVTRTSVERVDRFRYLGVHIMQDLSRYCHINTLEILSASLPPSMLKGLQTALYGVNVLIESNTEQSRNSTKQNRQLPVLADCIMHTEFPHLQFIYSKWCCIKAR